MAEGASTRLSLKWLALIAFVVMFLEDVFGTVMVIFESKYNWVGAGIFDVLGWLTMIASTLLAADAVLKEGWRSTRARVIVLAISAANFLGTGAGVQIARLVTHHG